MASVVLNEGPDRFSCLLEVQGTSSLHDEGPGGSSCFTGGSEGLYLFQWRSNKAYFGAIVNKN